MIYGSWNIRCDRQKFSSFWAIFCPFSPLTSWKIKILTLKKKNLNILSSSRFVPLLVIIHVWFLRYGAQQTLSFVILYCFLPFYPSIDPENQNFEKMKTIPEDIIILQICTINDSHMMYGSWDMEHDGQNFLSFWNIFCPFTPLPTQKIKILKKIEKPPGDIIILHRCNINDNHMYGSWDTECYGHDFLSFCTSFCPFTP